MPELHSPSSGSGRRRYFAAAGALLVAIGPADAAGSSDLWRLRASLPDRPLPTGSEFGRSVALSGDLAVVCASSEHTNSTDSGAVYVFGLVDGEWLEEARIVGSATSVGGSLGPAIAVHGTTILIGAHHADVAHLNDGAVTVFVRDASGWHEQATLLSPLPQTQGAFGISVALHGDLAVVGAWREGPAGGPESGLAHVFRRSGAAWSLVQTLAPSDAGPSFLFGASVSISGPLVAVGAPGAGGNAAYLFQDLGAGWQELARLTASDAGPVQQFGASTSLDPARLVVGAPLDDAACPTDITCDSGAAYVFARTPAGWVEEAKVRGSNNTAGDETGRSVSLSGDSLLVGAEFDLVGGSAYVFTRAASGWEQQARLVDNTSDWGRFGSGVSISGDRALVGAPTGDLTGRAYVFERAIDCDGDEQADEDQIALDPSLDCDLDGRLDACQIQQDPALDWNGNGHIDACECVTRAYCIAAPNSVGAGMLLDALGTTSLSEASFVLRATGGPAGQPALFYYGDDAVQEPFGNGFRCVGQGLLGTFRLDPPLAIGLDGEVDLLLDFEQPPAGSGSGAIEPGTRWYFQLWYRDPQAGGTGFNFSNGLQATFCP